jgi:hypothetical protein
MTENKTFLKKQKHRNGRKHAIHCFWMNFHFSAHHHHFFTIEKRKKKIIFFGSGVVNAREK